MRGADRADFIFLIWYSSELNDNNDEYRPRLLNNLEQYTLVCNTSDPDIGGEMVELFSYPLQVTTSLKVGFNNQCKDTCKCKYEIIEDE